MMKIWKSKLFLFSLFLIFVYKSIFNSFTGQAIVNYAINSFLEGESKIRVTKFSLLFGFQFHDIDIRPPVDSPNESSLFTAKEFNLSYNIPMIFLGRIKLSELSLTEPKLFLQKKNGRWNFEKLSQPDEAVSQEDAEKLPEPEVDEMQSDSVHTFFPISLFSFIKIDNLSAEISIEDQNTNLNARIHNFNFEFLLDTYRFRKIPLSPEAVSILDELRFRLNPDQPLNVRFYDGDISLEKDFDLKVILDFINRTNSFQSHIDIGSDQIPIEWNNRKIQNFSFRILSDMKINTESDSLTWEKFQVLFQNRAWIDFQAKVHNLTTSNPEILLESKPTSIDFSEIQSVVSNFPTLKKVKMSGSLNLQKFDIRGTLKDTFLSLLWESKYINISIPGGSHRIRDLKLDIFANLNLSPEESENADPLALIREAKANAIQVNYNGIQANLRAQLIPDSIVDLNLLVKNVVLQQFTKEAQGIADLKLTAQGKSLSNVRTSLELVIRDLRYFLGKSLSGKQKAVVTIQKDISIDKNFQPKEIDIPSIAVKLFNSKQDEFTTLTTALNVNLQNGLNLEVNRLAVKLDFTKMIPTLPIHLRNTIMNLRSNLGNKINLGGKLQFNESKTKDRYISCELTGSLPALNLNDLRIGADLTIFNNSEQTIQIKSIHLDAFQNKLRADYQGRFYKPNNIKPALGDFAGKLDGQLRLKSEKSEKILKGISFKGILGFDLGIKNEWISGRLHTEKTDIMIESDDCPGEECNTLLIKNLMLDIPFQHNLFHLKTASLTSGNKENMIQNYGTKSDLNFKIEKILATHPTITGQMIEYVYPENNLPGVSASIQYKENVFRINDFNANSLGGNITGKNILFNLGSGNPVDMELTAFFRIRDIDLKKLLPETSQTKIDDGKIKADLNLSLKDLSDPIGNTVLFFSIHQIGKDFGTSAVNIVSPTNLITDAIIRSYSVNRVEVELNKGLVYAEVLFNRSLLNRTLFGIENDRLKEERIPISKFLNQAKGELATYK